MLAAALAAAGLEPRLSPLLGQPGSPLPAGHAVVLGRIEIVSRLLDPTTVLIVRVHRLEAAPGLGSPLQGIARFVAVLARTRGETGLERVVGAVNTGLFRDAGGLDDDRLGAFYRRLHGAQEIDASTLPGLDALDRQLAGKGGARWVGLELDRFRGERLRGAEVPAGHR